MPAWLLRLLRGTPPPRYKAAMPPPTRSPWSTLAGFELYPDVLDPRLVNALLAPALQKDIKADRLLKQYQRRP